MILLLFSILIKLINNIKERFIFIKNGFRTVKMNKQTVLPVRTVFLNRYKKKYLYIEYIIIINLKKPFKLFF